MTKTVLLLLAAAAVLAPAVAARPDQAQSRAGAAVAMPPAFVRMAERLLASRFPHGQPGAVALVVKNGKTVFRRAYGLADLEFGIMLEPDMVFRVGPIGEQFTAGAVLQLVERGRLGFDDEVSTHLPDAPDAWKRVTVRHLLTHTSGLPDIGEMPEELGATVGWTLSRLITRLSERPLAFEPGTGVAYNDWEYRLLGAVLERASGQTHGDYLRQHVFVPLGMRQTVHDDPRRVVPRRARGYARQDGEWLNAGYVGARPDGIAAIASTVDDLALWNAGLDRARVFSAASVEQMFKASSTPAGGDSRLAPGGIVDTHDGHPFAEHGGRIAGFAAHLIRLPADGLFVVVLSNSEASAASSAARRLAALALGRPIVDPPEVTLAEPTLEAYTGRYEGGGASFDVRRDGTRLQVLWKKQATTVLAASAPNTFFEPDGVLRVGFGEDAGGAVDRAILTGWGTERVAKRTAE